MIRIAVLILGVASPAFADEALLEFMGGQGCTFGPDSIAAAQEAGFAAGQVNDLMTGTLADASATQQGDWVVLDASVCTIRLPEIESRWTVDDPEVRALIPYTRDEYTIGDDTIVSEGCFTGDIYNTFFLSTFDDADLAMDAYLRFQGAGIIAGDVGFYSTSPLTSPAGFQVTNGDCARAPVVEAINRSHPIIATGFGEYVRRVGAEAECDGYGATNASIAVDIQSVDIDADNADENPVNAWLFFEWDVITMAAGWHDGLSASSRGEPRPPLCHYPG